MYWAILSSQSPALIKPIRHAFAILENPTSLPPIVSTTRSGGGSLLISGSWLVRTPSVFAPVHARKVNSLAEVYTQLFFSWTAYDPTDRLQSPWSLSSESPAPGPAVYESPNAYQWSGGPWGVYASGMARLLSSIDMCCIFREPRWC